MTESSVGYTDINDNGLLDLDVYFDFLCPFTYQAMLWVDQISTLMGDDVISVRYRFFSLDQNHSTGEKLGWNIWDKKPGDADVKGLLPFLAGAAAYKAGGDKGLGEFYKVLAKMRHEDNLPIWEQSYVEQAWSEAGLDKAALAKVMDGSDRSGYEKLQKDHTEAVERYGAFGSPLLVFEESHPFFLKLMPRPTNLDDALELFQHVQRMAMGFRGGVLEFKQPITEARMGELREIMSNAGKIRSQFGSMEELEEDVDNAAEKALSDTES